LAANSEELVVWRKAQAYYLAVVAESEDALGLGFSYVEDFDCLVLA